MKTSKNETAITNKLKALQATVLDLMGTSLNDLVQDDINEMEKLVKTDRELQFVSNPQKRTVVALLVNKQAKKISRRGIAKCYYLDEYNEVVGHGVALRKVLNLEPRAWEVYL